MSTFVYLYRQIDVFAMFADPEPGVFRDPDFLEWARGELNDSIDRALKKMLISPYQANKLKMQLEGVRV